MKCYRYSIFSIYFFMRKKMYHCITDIIYIYISYIYFLFYIKFMIKIISIFTSILYVLFLYILFIFSQTLLEIANCKNYCRVITSTLDSIWLNFDEKLTIHNFYYEIYIKIERRYSEKLYFKF